MFVIIDEAEIYVFCLHYIWYLWHSPLHYRTGTLGLYCAIYINISCDRWRSLYRELDNLRRKNISLRLSVPRYYNKLSVIHWFPSIAKRSIAKCSLLDQQNQLSKASDREVEAYITDMTRKRKMSSVHKTPNAVRWQWPNRPLMTSHLKRILRKKANLSFHMVYANIGPTRQEVQNQAGMLVYRLEPEDKGPQLSLVQEQDPILTTLKSINEYF